MGAGHGPRKVPPHGEPPRRPPRRPPRGRLPRGRPRLHPLPRANPPPQVEAGGRGPVGGRLHPGAEGPGPRAGEAPVRDVPGVRRLIREPVFVRGRFDPGQLHHTAPSLRLRSAPYGAPASGSSDTARPRAPPLPPPPPPRPPP